MRMDRVEEALSDVRSALRADGYDLRLADDGGRIMVEVTAGPAACAECLIPKDVLVTVVRRAVEDVVGRADEGALCVVYPGER